MQSSPHRAEHLIVQTAFVGDLFLGIPFFQRLRGFFPGDKITLLCRKGLGEGLVALGVVDEAVEVDKAVKRSWGQALKTLKDRSFQTVFCPHQSLRSALVVARLRSELKIGYARFFNAMIFDHRIQRPPELPEALRQMALLVPLQPEIATWIKAFAATQTRPGGQNQGGLALVPEWASMRISRLSLIRRALKRGARPATEDPPTDAALMSEEERTEAIDRRVQFAWPGFSERARELGSRLASVATPVAFLAPGSVWPTKMWTSEGFRQVARDLTRQGYLVVLMGTAAEKVLCDDIVRGAPGVLSFAGETSLYESLVLLALGDLLICNDSGAMHMAAAAGIPTVAIFGPTVLDFGYRPWQNRAVVVEEELSCRPCGKHGAKVCPLGTHACMRQVSPETVLSRIGEIREKFRAGDE